jgi:hypothetical protein
MPSQLTAISPSPALRQYAFGAAQSAIQPVADFIAGVVEVTTSIGRYKIYSQKSQFHLPETVRATGGRAAEVTFGGTDGTYNCVPNAIDVPVDILQQQEAAPLESMLMESANMAAEIAALIHEKKVVKLAYDTLSGGATAVNTASTDPIAALDTAILSVIKAARYGSAMGVGIVFGPDAYKLVKNSTYVRSRFVTAGTPAFPNITPDVMKSLLLGLPDVMISFMVEDTAAEGVADSIDWVGGIGSAAIVFARKANATRRDPSFMKTFRLSGQWMVPGTYMRDDQRATVAKFDWSEDVVVTNSSAAAMLTFT